MSPAGAHITVDGKPVRSGVTTAAVTLTGGWHAIRAKHEDHDDLSVAIEVPRAGGTIRLRLELPECPVDSDDDAGDCAP